MAPPLITTLGGGSNKGFGQGLGAGGVTMPSGIIIPFTGASTPTDWTDFTAANDSAIVGAGSTYSAGSTGGSTSFSASVSFSGAGSHAGSGHTGAAGCCGPECEARFSAGSHSHTATLSGSGHPAYKKYKFIKATADYAGVPAGGIILGASSLGGDCTITDSGLNKLMYAGSSVTTGGSWQVSLSGTTNSAGTHKHTGYGEQARQDGSDPFQPRYCADSGAHTHTGTGNVNWQTKRMLMSAWSNASADFNFEGSGICMWESATPPDGWLLCDGTSGAVDLRDYFIEINDEASQGTTTGDNSNTFTDITASGTINHGHRNGSQQSGGSVTTSYHEAWDWTHAHSGSASPVTQVPPYYGLYFVQYAG